MPIYEYECLKCGQRFELRRQMTDSDSNIMCPKCGTKKPRRVISAFMMGPNTGGCASNSPT